MAVHDEGGDVGLVDHQVGGDAAGVVPIEAPLEVALLVEVLGGGGAEEALPVGVLLGGVGGNGVAPGRGAVGQVVAIPEGADVVAVADQALLDHRPRHLVEAVGAVLRADLDDALALGGDAHDLLRFFDGVGQRLLDVDVLAGGERVEQHAVMEMLRRGDDDRVDGLVGQQFLVVDVGLGRVLAERGDDVLALGQIAGEGVADARRPESGWRRRR